MSPSHAVVAGVSLFLLVAGALSPSASVARPSLEQEEAMYSSAAFLRAHPDLKFRRRGLDAYESGDAALAFRHFVRAARYADKPSQAMLAAMLWEGDGVARDRAAAYAWMDIAAERGFVALLARRETFWAGLDAAQRAQALAIGSRLQPEFGDAAAKPRLERQLRRARHGVTGSRVGFAGTPLRVTLNLGGERLRVQAHDYYHADYWQPERYWALQDAEWTDTPAGHVDVGALRPRAD